ncbi:uncharacterized protein J4E84_004604 [Alternaria hordeiaustralica]|uniref:uncharacterized protein n=1 Tax=Alternaria hordeiaustralica TaxID=1187925 RepID=UPI0020C36E59|nr:uncharacterized protein J4E84_004604 [Alternaria hordeiaustralica]KAI4688674.1 hypothetical protein J4E84_004604 [Alternaria hordeiaustralica]
MTPISQLSKADVRLFLRQLQANSADVTKWEPMMRLSLLRGGLIDFTIYGRRVASAPRLALMAASQSALAFLAKHPCAPAINFTFDVPAVQLRGGNGQAKLVSGKCKMREAQIKIHEAALVAISQWLTALCTPALMPLAGANFSIETCIRFICVHTLHAPEYVQHLTDKFITDAGRLALSSQQVTELVSSCRGDNDQLLMGLAEKLIGKKLDGQLAPKQLSMFLCKAGNELLKKKVETLEKEMGFTTKGTGPKAALQSWTEGFPSSFPTAATRSAGRIHETKDHEIIEIDKDVMEVDADGWQVPPRTKEDAAASKKRKLTHNKDGTK